MIGGGGVDIMLDVSVVCVREVDVDTLYPGFVVDGPPDLEEDVLDDVVGLLRDRIALPQQYFFFIVCIVCVGFPRRFFLRSEEYLCFFF